MKESSKYISFVKVRNGFFILRLFLFSTLILFSLSSFCQNQIIQKGSTLKNNFGFIENKGQVHDQNYLPNPAVKYLLSLGNGLNVQLKANSFSYDTYITERVKSDKEKPPSKFMDSTEMYDITYHFHRVDIELVNANPTPEIVAEGPSEDYLNYYNAVTPEEGATFIRSYQKVTYQNIYPGIDLEFQAKPGTEKPVEYNFIVHSGADASQIRLKYKGADETRLTEGKISVKVAHGNFYESIPQSHLKETNESIKVKYMLTGNNEFGFQIPRFNEKQTLIIDPVPVLEWGTYYGVSGQDFGTGIATDESENVFVTGGTQSTSSIATSGAFQTTLNGINDAFVVKFNISGQRQWGTYFGGNSYEGADGIVYDQNGNVVVIGTTSSTSGIATSGVYQTAFNGTNDAFIIKFNTSGQRQWGSYYGGSSTDNGHSITTDQNGNIFITGSTNSSSNIASSGIHQTTLGGQYDAFIVKFNSSGQRQWGTYYGGSLFEEGNGICTDTIGNVFVTGITYSTTSIATSGVHQTILGGGRDAFIVKFNSSGQRQWGTYYGGNNDDFSYMIATDTTGNVLITGWTTSISAIATSGVYQSSLVGYSDAFIVKFNSSGQRIWGTYFGGNGDDRGFCIATDTNGCVFVTGITTSVSSIATSGAYQTIHAAGTWDIFIVKFNNSGQRQWGTYYGGNKDDNSNAITTDTKGNVFVTGFTSSTSAIATLGAHQTSAGGGHNAFIAKFSECDRTLDTISMTSCDSFDFNGKILYYTGNYNDTIKNYCGCDSIIHLHLNILKAPKTQFSVNDSSQCILRNLFSFTNSSSVDTGSISYQWYFGDNYSSKLASPSHSYNQPDTFSIKLITVSDYGCRDSLMKNVVVKPMPVADFKINDSIQCIGINTFNFTNKSSPDTGKTAYLWNFGDGDTSALENPSHSYLSSNTYNVKLTFTSALGCMDSVSKPVYVITDSNLTATFEINDSTQCFNKQNFIINNKSSISSGVLTNTWYIDQDTFTTANLQFSNLPIGIHALKLITSTEHGCTDTTSKNLYVCPLPKAGFTVTDAAQCSIYNRFDFTNTSTISADTLFSLWDFGDNTNSTSASQIYKYHSTGSFRAKLTVTSSYGCSDSAVKFVIVSPEAEISSVTNGSNCGTGQVFLQARALNGNISWYASSFGGALLDTGNIYTTDILSSSATFYAEAANAGCTSPRNSVEAYIIPIPSIVSTFSQPMAGPGSATLTAQPSAGNVAWYDLPMGGNQLFVGTSFFTPYLTATTSFYAEAQYKGCFSYPRTAVTATIPNSIDNIADHVKVTVYPNPTHDYIIISVNGLMEPAKLEIRDVQGRVLNILEIKPSGIDYIERIDLHGLEQGIYNFILLNKRVNKTFRIVKF